MSCFSLKAFAHRGCSLTPLTGALRARHSKRSSYTEPVSARARVNDLKQLVITSKCKGGGSRVDVCRVNLSGENAQRVLGVDSVAKYTIEEGYGDRDDGSPGVLTGGEFAPHDFSAIGAEEELHLVLDTDTERQAMESRTAQGDKAYAERLTNHTRTVQFFVDVAFLDVAETIFSAYLYPDGFTALEALAPGWLGLELDAPRPGAGGFASP